jgi:hypothetical protein
MLFNPRYGRMGTVVLPYYLFFEYLGAVVELVGLAAVTLGLALGVIDVGTMVLFLVASFVFGLLVSSFALAIEEYSYHRYERFRDLPIAALASLLEVIVFRPIHALWRLEGVYRALRGAKSEWEPISRSGFTATEVARE